MINWQWAVPVNKCTGGVDENERLSRGGLIWMSGVCVCVWVGEVK